VFERTAKIITEIPPDHSREIKGDPEVELYLNLKEVNAAVHGSTREEIIVVEKYEGEFEHNVYSGLFFFFFNFFLLGEGTLTLEDETKISGHFANNQPNGIGTATYPNGDVYRGIWKDGHRDGLNHFFFFFICVCRLWFYYLKGIRTC
jgi:hypothetical protein